MPWFCPACATPNPTPRGNAPAACAACGAPLADGASPAWRAGTGGETGRARLRLAILLAPLLILAVTLAGFGARAWVEERRLARHYARAEDAAAAGRIPAAIAAYAAAGGHRDAADRRAALLAPYRRGYLDGVAALEAGRHDAAIAALQPVARDLPRYEDAAARLGEARAGHLDALRRAATTAEADEDWLAAERAWVLVAAADPDGDATAHLANLQRHRAPLLYARDRALYLAAPDGSGERLVTDAVPVAWPTWNPDKTRIAFVSHDPAGPDFDGVLYVVDPDGRRLTRLDRWVHPSQWPVWSPDGTRLAFTSFARFDFARNQGAIGVRVVDVATGRPTDLTAGRLNYAGSPTWAPDGRRLGFVSRQVGYDPRSEIGIVLGKGDAFVLDLDSGAWTNATRGRIPDIWRAAWAPVGERLLLVERRWGGWSEPDALGLQILDAATGTLRPIAAGLPSVGLPAWSPDGSRLAFVAGPRTLRLRHADGGERRITLPVDLTGVLAWSPDGGALLAAGDLGRDSYLVTADGSVPPAKLALEYDIGGRDGGGAAPPQWGARNQPAPFAAPTVGGTGWDHAGASPPVETGAVRGAR